MDSNEALAGDPPLPAGRFSGRVEFQQLVRDALACAARESWPELILSDPDFEDWPLGERVVAQSLQDWSATGRHCILLAGDYGAVVRRHPRFVSWRKTWTHIIEARGVAQAGAELPSAIWSPSWMMQRVDPVRCNGISGTEPARRVLLRENLREWLQKSASAFPSTTLGL